MKAKAKANGSAKAHATGSASGSNMAATGTGKNHAGKANDGHRTLTEPLDVFSSDMKAQTTTFFLQALHLWKTQIRDTFAGKEQMLRHMSMAALMRKFDVRQQL